MKKKMTRNLIHIFLATSAIFIISAVSADLLASIDCGSSDTTYTDPNNSIIWLSDDDYISTGDSKVVLNSNSLSHVMDTLRVFTSRNKNCYAIPIDRGTKILARASFYYGDYDQKSTPPSFNLQFDGNEWGTVQTMIDSITSYEVTYVVKGDSTSICLAQTNPGQYPFINALEIRSLDPKMYSDGNVDRNRALFLRRRVAYGTNDTIRYSDDPYDRIWTPSPGGNGLIPAATESPIILASGLDQPPATMLQNAVTTLNVSDFISLGAVFPATGVPAYLNLYFSEVSQLDPTTGKRSFVVYRNADAISDSISPPFGNFVEFNVNNVMVDANTTFYVVADNGSTLPPIVNGMEIFYISDPLTNGTNSKDVGLTALQETFDVLQEWSGDPCLPAPYSWDWVNCSLDTTPRITALYLSGFGLSGELPDISSMDSLESIDLQNNTLSGSIPEFLGSLPNLKKLNLAENQFSGPIPASLSKKNNLDLVVSPGNPNLCTSEKSCKTTPSTTSGSPAAGSSPKKKSSSKLPLILGIVIPVAVIIWAVICVFLILHFKRKRAIVSTINPGQNGGVNGGGVNGQAMGKVGMAAFNAFVRNENTNTDTNTTSGDNQTV